MAVIRSQENLPARHGPGWRQLTCCDQDIFGVPVPMRASRYVVDPLATCPGVSADADEAMIYVVGGSGTLALVDDEHSLMPEGMVWLTGGAEMTFRAGEGGLDVLVATVRGESSG